MTAKPKTKPVPRPYTERAHPSYVIEPCPACGHPEADGGYCEECGWTRACGCAWCKRRAR